MLSCIEIHDRNLYQTEWFPVFKTNAFVNLEKLLNDILAKLKKQDFFFRIRHRDMRFLTQFLSSVYIVII